MINKILTVVGAGITAGLIIFIMTSLTAQEPNAEELATVFGTTEDAANQQDASSTTEAQTVGIDLPLSDNAVSLVPEAGKIFTCSSSFSGTPSGEDPSWIFEGTWDPTRKIKVAGQNIFENASITFGLVSDNRMIVGNSLPSTPTGNFPATGTANEYALSSSGIVQQPLDASFAATPTASTSPNCVDHTKPIGIFSTGAYLFSGINDFSQDAPARLILDECEGAPDAVGRYGHFTLTTCLDDVQDGDHSEFMAYSLDGYGIYGKYGEDGEQLTNEDLDECHGHTHEIVWDGQETEIYHYHFTDEFPYSIGCFHAEASQ